MLDCKICAVFFLKNKNERCSLMKKKLKENKMEKLIMAIITFIVLFGGLYAEDIQLTGHDIMVMVDEREDGDSRKSEITMTLINKRNRQRVRKITNLTKEYGDDSKSVMMFNHPADVKGTGFLSWEYENQSKEDARWLYMPALKKTRRISGSSDNDYFMGSDFTYDDLGDRSVDEDTHRLIGEKDCKGQTCWIVESIPLGDDEAYTKRICYVSKALKMFLKVEYFNRLGLMKTLHFEDIDKIDGIWTAQTLIMDNISNKHKTKIEFSDIHYNLNIKDDMFTVGTIRRGRI